MIGKSDRKATILYGQMGDSSVQSFAEKLVQDGMEGIYVYSGGWAEWAACGLPIEGDTKTIRE